MLQPGTGELAVIELEELELLHSVEVRECGVGDWRAIQRISQSCVSPAR